MYTSIQMCNIFFSFQEQKKLRKDLEEEVKARKRLESLMPNTLKNIPHNATWEENMT